MNTEKFPPQFSISNLNKLIFQWGKSGKSVKCFFLNNLNRLENSPFIIVSVLFISRVCCRSQITKLLNYTRKSFKLIYFLFM